MTPVQAQTLFLMHFDSATADFKDSSPRRLTFTKNGTLGASSASKFGAYCYENANNTWALSGLSVDAPSPGPDFGAYSLEAWVYPYVYPDSGMESVIVAKGYGSFLRPGLVLQPNGQVWLRRADTENSNNTIGNQYGVAPLNQWTHILAANDSRGVTRMWFNGVVTTAAAAVNMTTTYPSNSSLYNWGIGSAYQAGGNPFRGKLDELRVVLGLSPREYTLAPLTAAFPDSAGSDPNFSSVALLLHGDGADGGTTIVDSSANTLVATQVGSSGNVTTTAVQYAFGGTALRFAGTQAITFVRSPTFEAASRDWTIETRIRIDSSSTTGIRHIWQLFGSSINYRCNLAYETSTGRLTLYTENGAGTGTNRLYSQRVPVDTWLHIALCKEGWSYTLWVDGEAHAGIYSAFMATGNMGLAVGTQNFSTVATDVFQGYIEEFRVTMGIARYPMNFTPPTTAYADCPVPDNFALSVPVMSRSLGYAPTRAAVEAQVTNLKDVYDGGRGFIFGSVKEKMSPSNLPLHRRVWLMRERDGRVVRETWSDAATGNFAFEYIDERERYSTISYDHLHNYRAVIADNLQPTVI